MNTENPKQLIHDLDFEELCDSIKEFNQPAYRAKQVWEWLYKKYAIDWSEFKNIPSALQTQLADKFAMPQSNQNNIARTDDKKTKTTKFLYTLNDGDRVESVIIPAGARNTLCVSCQVGCKFRCAFCASGQAGLIRNLSAGEIIGQLIFATTLAGSRLNNVVFMGMGEPFDNYDAVIKAARIMNHHNGLDIGARRITISTAGIIPGIKKFAEEGLQFELSVSLHAADNALRNKLMPINNKYPLNNLIETCKKYTEQTNRIITFEYTLIKDINDHTGDCKRLIRLLKPLKCRVNIINLNKVKEYKGHPTSPEKVRFFAKQLYDAGINATIREPKGNRTDAACGQLRFG